MRQYIGARYMPKFMGPYDATTEYEALSVVDNGMGTSYVSIKPVPVNTPLTNTNYWAVYGSSSGAILNLQQQIDRIDSFGDLKNKKIAIFGASNELAAWTGGISWVDSLATILDGYSTIVNKSVAGRTLTTAISDFIADADRTTYDIVIFSCTRNQYRAQTAGDLGTGELNGSNISNAINSLSAYKTLTQQFFFASCTPYVDDFLGMPMCCYDGLVKKIVEKNGYSMLDMHSWLGTSNENSAIYTSDNLHLLPTVAPIYAIKALKALLKGNEPFANYVCRLEGSDIENYTGWTKRTGVDIYTGSPIQHSFLECDVNGECYGQLYLINNTGLTIQVDESILTMSDTVPTPFMLPWYNLKNLITSFPADLSVIIDYQNRSRGLVMKRPIANGDVFCVTWGTVNSYLKVSK